MPARLLFFTSSKQYNQPGALRNHGPLEVNLTKLSTAFSSDSKLHAVVHSKMRHAMKNVVLTLGLVLIGILSSFSQVGVGGIKGTVTESNDKESPLPFADVALWQGGSIIAGTITDDDGDFEIKALSPGKYKVVISSMGYHTQSLNGVIVNSNKTTSLRKEQCQLTSTALELGPVDITAEEEYEIDIIDMDGPTTIGMDAEQVMRSPDRNLKNKITQMPRMVSSDNGSNSIFAGGQRDGAGYIMVDGQKRRSLSGIPMTSIQSMEAMLGGVPASYGDATGAIISITTKAATTDYHGSIEHITSGAKLGERYYVLDPFGYNLTEFSLSGPLIVKRLNDTTKQVLVGFFVSGNYINQLDPRPSAVGAWKVKDDVLDDLKSDPLRQGFTENSVIPNTDYLRLSDFERVSVRPNTERSESSLTAKLNVNTTKNTTLTFGGNYNSTSGNRYDFEHSLLDFQSYPLETSRIWGVYGRFTQRFQNVDEDNRPSGLIPSAFYTIQADYTREYFNRQNEDFGDDFFKYGYLGKFTTYQAVDYAQGQDSATGIFGNIQQTYRDTLITFEAGDANPELAQFTQRYYELNGWEGFDAEGNPVFDRSRADALANYNNIQSGGGLINGDNLDSRSRSVYGMWSYNNDLTNAHGGQTDNYAESIADQLRLTGQGSADIGDHSIIIGFEYEQRIERGYSLNPRSLWTIARQRANSHIEQLDFDNSTIEYPGPYITYDRLNSAPGDYTAADEQSFIDYNMRKAIGLNPDGIDYLDINSIDPDLFRIEYFSANELYNGGSSLVNYYGYDPYGNRTRSRSGFDDFFTETDEYGNLTRPVDAFRPVYSAGYIEDKFEFRDINFRIGIRVDQYDANQQVLKDPYVLFPTIKAGEQEALDLLGEGMSNHPSNIGDDFVVYVDNVKSPTEILGYRNGDVWYNSEGAEMQDASALRVSNGLPAPLLVDKDATNSVDITSESFEDYKPKTNIMPRIAFNFPISDVAKFYAYYDILTKRPTIGNRLDPSDYYYLESRASSAQLNNPNLQPEQTTSYEVGFEQKVTYNSAIRFAAFYSESRNLVQATRVFDAYPIEYHTFDNIDVATVKGMTISYDYRARKNLKLRAYYTLQFAEGTGSNATSQLNLARTGEPNLRAPIRLSYDQRHQVTANIDYRFAAKKWNGISMLEEHVLLRNSGVNIQIRGGSGMPYNPQANVTSTALFANNPSPLQRGTINSAEMPWKFRFDMGVDRSFDIARTDTTKEAYQFVVTCQVLNVLNARTLNNVYRATGNADDDGYLASSIGQNYSESQNSESSFQEYYAMKLMNPNNWELPRRIQLGVRMMF